MTPDVAWLAKVAPVTAHLVLAACNGMLLESRVQRSLRLLLDEHPGKDVNPQRKTHLHFQDSLDFWIRVSLSSFR